MFLMVSGLLLKFQETCCQAPARVLVQEAGRGCSWSGRALLERLDQMDANLPGREDWRGQLVALSSRDRFVWLMSFLLCLRRGAVALPLDADIPPFGLQKLIKKIRPYAFLADGKCAPSAPDTCPPPAHAMFAKLSISNDGQPRPIFFTESQIISDGQRILRATGMERSDVTLGVLPLGNSYGFGNLVLPLLLEGVRMVIGSSALPSAIAQDVATARPSILPLVPSLLRALTRSTMTPNTFHSLRTVISAGDNLPPDLIQSCQQKFAVRIDNFFGATETGGMAYDTGSRLTLQQEGVGRLLEGVAMHTNAEGHLVACSSAVFSIENPEAQNGLGCCTLADKGHVTTNGTVVLNSRSPDTIKIGGRRLDRREILTWLQQEQHIEHASLEAYQDEHGETRCCLRYVGAPHPQQLRLLMQREFPRWKIPHRLQKV